MSKEQDLYKDMDREVFKRLYADLNEADIEKLAHNTAMELNRKYSIKRFIASGRNGRVECAVGYHDIYQTLIEIFRENTNDNLPDHQL